jgi:hypothetical protein
MLFMGMPAPDPGPVSGMLTPMDTSAWAAAANSSAEATANALRLIIMTVS